MIGNFALRRRSSSGKSLMLPSPNTTRGVEAEEANLALSCVIVLEARQGGLLDNSEEISNCLDGSESGP